MNMYTYERVEWNRGEAEKGGALAVVRGAYAAHYASAQPAAATSGVGRERGPPAPTHPLRPCDYVTPNKAATSPPARKPPRGPPPLPFAIRVHRYKCTPPEERRRVLECPQHEGRLAPQCA